jgi:hypothetical protein
VETASSGAFPLALPEPHSRAAAGGIGEPRAAGHAAHAALAAGVARAPRRPLQPPRLALPEARGAQTLPARALGAPGGGHPAAEAAGAQPQPRAAWARVAPALGLQEVCVAALRHGAHAATQEVGGCRTKKTSHKHTPLSCVALCFVLGRISQTKIKICALEMNFA